MANVYDLLNTLIQGAQRVPVATGANTPDVVGKTDIGINGPTEFGANMGQNLMKEVLNVTKKHIKNQTQEALDHGIPATHVLSTAQSMFGVPEAQAAETTPQTNQNSNTTQTPNGSSQNFLKQLLGGGGRMVGDSFGAGADAIMGSHGATTGRQLELRANAPMSRYEQASLRAGGYQAQTQALKDQMDSVDKTRQVLVQQMKNIMDHPYLNAAFGGSKLSGNKNSPGLRDQLSSLDEQFNFIQNKLAKMVNMHPNRQNQDEQNSQMEIDPGIIAEARKRGLLQ